MWVKDENGNLTNISTGAFVRVMEFQQGEPGKCVVMTAGESILHRGTYDHCRAYIEQLWLKLPLIQKVVMGS